ncbi:MAG TPA: ADYC domain-containing protein [Kofleriaceae bacterium]|nr:ADYC domain-containing protein [Kofleriaceae bacterium]
MPSSSRFFLPLLLAGPGCTEPAPDVELHQLAFCPEFGCSTNGPEVKLMTIADLSEDRNQYNSAGFRVVGMSKAGDDYTVAVFGDRLYGLDDMGNVGLFPHQLDDAVIHLEHRTEGPFELHLLEVHYQLTFWVGQLDNIYTYKLGWTDPVTPHPEPVCPQFQHGDEWGPPGAEAIFFQGDLYDDVTKEVTAIGADAVGSWFNVACAGSATAKMHATRHTTAGSDQEHQSTRDRRQAMLKMYTADYCGTGKAFTKLGEPLDWENIGGWKTLGDDPPEDEAVWDQTGAKCLDTPRMGETAREAADWKQAIDAECERFGRVLPSCAELKRFPEEWQEYGYVRTANPSWE